MHLGRLRFDILAMILLVQSILKANEFDQEKRFA